MSHGRRGLESSACRSGTDEGVKELTNKKEETLSMATVPGEKESESKSGELPNEEERYPDELRHDRVLGVLLLVGFLTTIGLLIWLAS
jgi:hypothetical protein